MSAYSVEVKVENGVKHATLKGSMIINHIEKLYEELSELASPEEDLNITVEADNIDITYVQLVIAMQKAWAASGKKLNITSNVPEDLEALLAKAGIDKEVINIKA